MDHTAAMRLYAIIRYLVAALAETGGLALVLCALKSHRATLERWAEANPKKNEGG